MAISFCRAAPRESSRPAMLTQAISSTSAAQPIKTSKGCAYRRRESISPCPPASARSMYASSSVRPVSVLVARVPVVSDCCHSSSIACCIAGVRSAMTCSRDTPGRRRPIMFTHRNAGRARSERSPPSSGSTANGSVKSGDRATSSVPANPSGVTPTIVNGFLLMRMALPTMFGLRSKRRVQCWCVMVATGGAPGLSSSSVSVLPSAAPTPRPRK